MLAQLASTPARLNLRKRDLAADHRSVSGSPASKTRAFRTGPTIRSPGASAQRRTARASHSKLVLNWRKVEPRTAISRQQSGCQTILISTSWPNAASLPAKAKPQSSKNKPLFNGVAGQPDLILDQAAGRVCSLTQCRVAATADGFALPLPLPRCGRRKPSASFRDTAENGR
jgi:hypothetical protein